MTRRYITICNVCDRESTESEPKGWFAVSWSVKPMGSKQPEHRAYADVCSGLCRTTWLTKQLAEADLPSLEVIAGGVE